MAIGGSGLETGGSMSARRRPAAAAPVVLLHLTARQSRRRRPRSRSTERRVGRAATGRSFAELAGRREGRVWTIGAGKVILSNCGQEAGGCGSQILWRNATLYVLGTDANWWQWVGNGWVNVGSTTPGGGSAGGAPSPDGTTIPTTATQI